MFSIDTTRSKSFSKSKSMLLTGATTPRNKQAKTTLYDLPKIPSYYKIDRPSFSKQRRKDIEEKLTINKSVENATNKRIKHGDLFLKYKKNPFLNRSQTLLKTQRFDRQVNKTKEAPPVDFYQKKRLKTHANIVNSVNDLRTKNEIVQINNQSKLRREFNEDVSRRLCADFKQQPLILNHKIEQEQQLQNINKIDEMDFDQIVGIEEENFYIKNQKPINIFSILYRTPDVLNSSVLDRHYFSFISTIQKVSKFRDNSNRDISRKSREKTMKKRFERQQWKKINEEDIPTNPESLRFQDLISVASGRCTPQTIKAFLSKNTRYDEFDFNALIEVECRERQRNKKVECTFQGEEIYQVKKFVDIGVTADERSYRDKCRDMKEKILAQMGEKKDASKQKVKDTRLHNRLTDKMKQEILYFIDLHNIERHPQDVRGTSKFLSKNLSFSKAVAIKAKELTSGLRTIKQEQNEINFINGPEPKKGKGSK